MAAYKDEVRNTYQVLKESALGTYFDGCRDLAVMGGWTHAQIVGYVSYSYEEGFERPIEDLMWQVVLLILSGGWHSDWDIRQRQLISNRITERGIEGLLADVPEEEAELFKHDLKILRLI